MKMCPLPPITVRTESLGPYPYPQSRYLPGKEPPEPKNSSTETSGLWDRELDEEMSTN